MVPRFCKLELLWLSYGLCMISLCKYFINAFCTKFLSCFMLEILVYGIMSGFCKSGHILCVHKTCRYASVLYLVGNGLRSHVYLQNKSLHQMIKHLSYY